MIHRIRNIQIAICFVNSNICWKFKTKHLRSSPSTIRISLPSWQVAKTLPPQIFIFPRLLKNLQPSRIDAARSASSKQVSNVNLASEIIYFYRTRKYKIIPKASPKISIIYIIGLLMMYQYFLYWDSWCINASFIVSCWMSCRRSMIIRSSHVV